MDRTWAKGKRKGKEPMIPKPDGAGGKILFESLVTH
jgi:hypothetical protein